MAHGMRYAGSMKKWFVIGVGAGFFGTLVALWRFVARPLYRLAEFGPAPELQQRRPLRPFPTNDTPAVLVKR